MFFVVTFWFLFRVSRSDGSVTSGRPARPCRRVNAPCGLRTSSRGGSRAWRSVRGDTRAVDDLSFRPSVSCRVAVTERPRRTSPHTVPGCQRAAATSAPLAPQARAAVRGPSGAGVRQAFHAVSPKPSEDCRRPAGQRLEIFTALLCSMPPHHRPRAGPGVRPVPARESRRVPSSRGTRRRRHRWSRPETGSARTSKRTIARCVAGPVWESMTPGCTDRREDTLWCPPKSLRAPGRTEPVQGSGGQWRQAPGEPHRAGG
jgi:hypothetical protein